MRETATASTCVRERKSRTSQKALLETEGVEVCQNGIVWYVVPKKYGWITTVEDVEDFKERFDRHRD